MKNEDLGWAIENILFAAGQPVSLAELHVILEDYPGFSLQQLDAELHKLELKYQDAAVELKKLTGGYVMQTRVEYAPWIQKLWLEKPRKYSQALLEVLAIIVYQQPVTRAEIEQQRGVSLAPNILKTLLEREWIVIVGYKDSPGRPAMYGSTDKFLDYFNLTSIADIQHCHVEPIK